MTTKFDVLVIGGGSGGLAFAQRAAEYGAKTAVIEYKPLGGTCVNVGCVPKKIMWYAAHHRHQAELARTFGFDIDIRGHDWGTLKERRDAYIERLNGIYERNLANKDIEVIRGEARIVDRHRIEVDGEVYEAERLVIAAGGPDRDDFEPERSLKFPSNARNPAGTNPAG